MTCNNENTNYDDDDDDDADYDYDNETLLIIMIIILKKDHDHTTNNNRKGIRKDEWKNTEFYSEHPNSALAFSCVNLGVCGLQGA